MFAKIHVAEEAASTDCAQSRAVDLLTDKRLLSTARVPGIEGGEWRRPGADTHVALKELLIKHRGEDKCVHDRDVYPKGKPIYAPSSKL